MSMLDQLRVQHFSAIPTEVLAIPMAIRPRSVPARIHNASSGGSGRCRIIEITNLLGPTLSGSSLKLESMAGAWLKWLRSHYMVAYIAVYSDPRNRLDLSRPTDNFRNYLENPSGDHPRFVSHDLSAELQRSSSCEASKEFFHWKAGSASDCRP